MTTKRKAIDDGSEDLLVACVRLKARIEKKLKSGKLSPEDRTKFERALRTTERNIGRAKRMV
jgi:hypothetical protein